MEKQYRVTGWTSADIDMGKPADAGCSVPRWRPYARPDTRIFCDITQLGYYVETAAIVDAQTLRIVVGSNRYTVTLPDGFAICEAHDATR